MQSKISLRLLLFITGFIVIIFIATTYFTHLIPDNNFVSAKQTALYIPTHLIISKINLDAPIESAGITSNGEMGVPKILKDVAWFNLSAAPGSPGTAVLSGHYGLKNSLSGAFDNLHKLQKGDEIYIVDDKGEKITFVVREIVTYNDDDSAEEVFQTKDNGAHLNLITCQGIWNKIKKSYSQRLVVFTDRVEEK